MNNKSIIILKLFFLIYACNTKKGSNNQEAVDANLGYSYPRSGPSNGELRIEVLAPRNRIILDGTVYTWELYGPNLKNIVPKQKGNIEVIDGKGTEKIPVYRRNLERVNITLIIKKNNKVVGKAFQQIS